MTSSAVAPAPHLLVVGIDGVRFDSLQAADTPALSSLATAGILLPVQVHEKNPTISGPVWSTVATGVHMDRHQVTGNGPQHKEASGPLPTRHPDFLARIGAARPEAATMVAVSWFPLAADYECGPIFSGPSWLPSINPDFSDDHAAAWIQVDDEVADYATERLATEDLAVSFVYFGEVDEYAHRDGTDAGYQAAIERCDARLARLLEVVRGKVEHGEDWTVIVVTDHGHIEGGGHGGDSPAERTAWIAAAGAGIDSSLTGLLQADIPAHALHLFGLPHTDLDGVPFGHR
ncbi:alkaline phosphatase family protein [Psychromicrobium xiongbiense]|uniref:alkaline phosphatase family protein n=1 Tax=Psychromicrobium xiongbiense TaxID=3051184 RepID=UPI0025578C59|nr:alkaline phosphatase family protein [Psychromicrobium sp. YIM S02556]